MAHTAKPSFDCALASTWAENQVCASDALAKSDRTVAALYRHRLATAAAADLEQLKQAQRDWIAQRNACGPDTGITCVYQAYEDRIAELTRAPAPALAPAPAPAPAPAAPPTILAAPAPPQRPRFIRDPNWIARPGPRELAQYYPPAARAAGVDGRATMQCGVSADGALVNCGVVSEDPARFGFGSAVLQLAPLFRMSGASPEGEPTASGVVRLTITFRHAPRRSPFDFGGRGPFGR